MQLIVRNNRTGSVFDVVSYDKTTETLTLKGKYATFKTEYSKPLFERLGYTIMPKPADTSEVKKD